MFNFAQKSRNEIAFATAIAEIGLTVDVWVQVGGDFEVFLVRSKAAGLAEKLHPAARDVFRMEMRKLDARKIIHNKCI